MSRSFYSKEKFKKVEDFCNPEQLMQRAGGNIVVLVIYKRLFPRTCEHMRDYLKLTSVSLKMEYVSCT